MRPSAIVTGFLVLSVSLGLEAQIPEGLDEGTFQPHPEAEEAISRLYSPFCPGFMLDVCTSGQAAALRDSMQMLAYEGWSSEQLVDWMTSNYGDQYRAVPQGGGVGIWAWVLPPVALLLGGFMVFLALRRFEPAKREDHTADADSVGKVISSEEEERLRSAIREIELSEDPSF